MVGKLAIAEMREFAGFAPAAQLYIRRSIGIARHGDPPARFSRSPAERASIERQAKLYERLPELRARVPAHSDIGEVAPFMAPLVRMTAFDLAQERLPGFAAYRFLYERLIGAGVRPFLLGAFCAAAALPLLKPAQRRALFISISESAATTPGWSDREPSFYPEWIEPDAPEPEPEPEPDDGG